MISESVFAKVVKVFEEEGLQNIKINLEPGSKAGDGYASVMARADVVGKREGQQEKHDVMIKSAPINLECRKSIPMTAAFNREVLFYTKIVPIYRKIEDDANIPDESRLKLAKCYGSSNEFGSEFLILNNLKSLGFALIKNLNVDYDHTLLTVRNLGQLHALSVAFKNRYSKEFNDLIPQLTDVRFKNTDHFDSSGILYYGDRTYQKFLENIKNINFLTKVKNSIGNSFSQKLVSFSKTGNKKIIIHGDCWLNNLLFKYENGVVKDLIPLDFQAVYYGSMANDILNYFGLASDRELRKHFWTFVDEYYNSFSRHLSLFNYDANQFCTKEEFMQEIKDQILFLLIMRIFTLPFFTLNQIFDANDLMGKRIPESFNIVTEEYVKSANDIVEDFVDFGFI